MKNQVKLSIVIPAYNVAGYIERCLDSIAKQTFQDYEVIIVDDGSTDGTSKICDRYAVEYEKFTVIHKNNEGVSIARNVGIEQVHGDYILFFDGDDFAEPYTCEELYDLAVEKQVDTVIYGYYTYESGTVKETHYPKFHKELYEGLEIMEDVFPRFIGLSFDSVNCWLHGEADALFVENPALWRTLVSTRIIRKNGIAFDKNLKVGEDTLFISEYLSFAEKCLIQQKCYYYLVTRETSAIYMYEKNPFQKLDGKIKLLKARYELSQKIFKRRKLDVNDMWRGTVIMSVMELAFLLSKKNKQIGFFKRYKQFKQYIKLEQVQKSMIDFKLERAINIKVIPFLMLRCRCYFLLFLCTGILHLIHYEFVRNT